MANLGGGDQYTIVLFTAAENKYDEAHVRELASSVDEKIEKSGREVFFTYVDNPGRHPLENMVAPVMLLMCGLGSLVIFLGAFLVINTMNALINQHTRQIGVMKSIGASAGQIIGMYTGLVLAFGTFALVISIPLSALAAWGSVLLLSKMLNFIPGDFRIPLPSLIVQFVVAWLIPLGASLLPVVKGARITVREAISSYGLAASAYRASRLDQFIEALWFIPRPLLVSLRNTFRRKARLVLTLTTLTMGGAIFIAVFNLRGSFDITVEKTLGYFLSDINISRSFPPDGNGAPLAQHSRRGARRALELAHRPAPLCRSDHCNRSSLHRPALRHPVDRTIHHRRKVADAPG